MTETFLAKIISIDEETEIITIRPLIVNVDGLDHIELSAKTLDGQEVNVNDIVIIETSKNNLDGGNISDYEMESRTNCIIVGVFTAQDGYKLKGSYKFTGDIEIIGNLTVSEDLTVTGKLTVTGNIEAQSGVDVTGNLIINGRNFLGHTHDPGSYVTTSSPVTGISGTVVTS